MADPYIDDAETFEYGDHLIAQLATLRGQSALVDVDALAAHVGAALAEVERELAAVGVKRGDLSASRLTVGDATPRARKELERFFHHLGSLDEDEVTFQLDAFFPAGNLGPLAALKPADVAARLDQALRGFELPIHAALPDGAKWKGRLTTARDALSGAVGGRGGATGSSIRGTAGLTAARAGFHTAYVNVARPLVKGLLASLGRADELRLFFLDLQVNEDGSSREAPATDALPPEP